MNGLSCFSIKMKTFKSNFMKKIKEYISSKVFWSSTAPSHRKEFIRTCNTWHTRLRYVANSDMWQTWYGVYIQWGWENIWGKAVVRPDSDKCKMCFSPGQWFSWLGLVLYTKRLPIWFPLVGSIKSSVFLKTICNIKPPFLILRIKRMNAIFINLNRSKIFTIVLAKPTPFNLFCK